MRSKILFSITLIVVSFASLYFSVNQFNDTYIIVEKLKFFGFKTGFGFTFSSINLVKLLLIVCLFLFFSDFKKENILKWPRIVLFFYSCLFIFFNNLIIIPAIVSCLIMLRKNRLSSATTYVSFLVMSFYLAIYQTMQFPAIQDNHGITSLILCFFISVFIISTYRSQLGQDYISSMLYIFIYFAFATKTALFFKTSILLQLFLALLLIIRIFTDDYGPDEGSKINLKLSLKFDLSFYSILICFIQDNDIIYLFAIKDIAIKFLYLKFFEETEFKISEKTFLAILFDLMSPFKLISLFMFSGLLGDLFNMMLLIAMLSSMLNSFSFFSLRKYELKEFISNKNNFILNIFLIFFALITFYAQVYGMPFSGQAIYKILVFTGLSYLISFVVSGKLLIESKKEKILIKSMAIEKFIDYQYVFNNFKKSELVTAEYLKKLIKLGKAATLGSYNGLLSVYQPIKTKRERTEWKFFIYLVGIILFLVLNIRR